MAREQELSSVISGLAQSFTESASGKSGRARAGMPTAGYPPWVRRRRSLPLLATPFACHEPTEDGLRRSTRRFNPGLAPLLDAPPLVRLARWLLARALWIGFLGPMAHSRQYHLPRAKPPKTTSPIKATISPTQKLQKIATTIPTITSTPPSEIPPIPCLLFRCQPSAKRPGMASNPIDGKVAIAVREHQLKITLSDDELALLDEQRPRGVSRPAYVRSLLREPPRSPHGTRRCRS